MTLSRKQVVKIYSLDEEGFSVGQIAKDLNISSKTITRYLDKPVLHNPRASDSESKQSYNVENDESVQNLQKILRKTQLRHEIDKVPVPENSCMDEDLQTLFDRHRSLENNYNRLLDFLEDRISDFDRNIFVAKHKITKLFKKMNEQDKTISRLIEHIDGVNR